MRAPVDVSSGAGVYKLMARRPRLPKAWEQDFAECQAFIAWADGIPESTPRALLPLIWPVRDRLDYQDAGGLNGYLKGFGITKRAWKAISSLDAEDTARAYAFFRARGDASWVSRLVVPADTLKEAAAEAGISQMVALAEAELSLEGIAPPYDQDWKLVIRALCAEVAGKPLEECEEAVAQAIVVRDYMQAGDADIGPGTTWAQMYELAQAWAETAELDEDDRPDVAAEQVGAVATPGGDDSFPDPASGFLVKRLRVFDEFVRESDLMGHCIGRSRTYYDKHAEGRGAFYSFRLPGQERPVATLELGVVGDAWRVCQCRGPSNRDPGEVAHELAGRLRQAHQHGISMDNSASYEVLDRPGGSGLPAMLDNTSSRYF